MNTSGTSTVDASLVSKSTSDERAKSTSSGTEGQTVTSGSEQSVDPAIESNAAVATPATVTVTAHADDASSISQSDVGTTSQPRAKYNPHSSVAYFSIGPGTFTWRGTLKPDYQVRAFPGQSTGGRDNLREFTEECAEVMREACKEGERWLWWKVDTEEIGRKARAKLDEVEKRWSKASATSKETSGTTTESTCDTLPKNASRDESTPSCLARIVHARSIDAIDKLWEQQRQSGFKSQSETVILGTD